MDHFPLSVRFSSGRFFYENGVSPFFLSNNRSANHSQSKLITNSGKKISSKYPQLVAAEPPVAIVG